MWNSFAANPQAASLLGRQWILTEGRLVGVEMLERFRTVKVTVAVRDYPLEPPTRWEWDQQSSTAIEFLCQYSRDVSVVG